MDGQGTTWERQEGGAVHCHLPAAEPGSEIKECLGAGKGGRREAKMGRVGSLVLVLEGQGTHIKSLLNTFPTIHCSVDSHLTPGPLDTTSFNAFWKES